MPNVQKSKHHKSLEKKKSDMKQNHIIELDAARERGLANKATIHSPLDISLKLLGVIP